ncbi:helix-turn-helix domain-containing protein [Actinokineospora xionganensis]|uniref:Helix-turn-helix domain-containing protein n=1 Tax=Actinokineospora xionganensis TaxID=2684470 RepID=A0ABR7LFB8_9PSEU|nr:helix-turn-helix transcriptional regulator [Actinokineospora xionganensis]MBC6451322.1 helix-turn-helix domain-containing protein [Actinokineospora xionganensis]
MISPYVRRQRLAVELRVLREAADLTHTELAKRIGQNRMKITRLENGHNVRDSQATVMRIIDELGVDGKRWTEIMAVARDASERGWWASFGQAMGARQALYADLEAGASAIAEFQPFIPGLLQTPEFAHQRQVAEAEIGPVTFQAERAVEARQTRQRMLRRPNGPAYEVVLDEIALRRLSAPPEVMAAQVEHMAGCARESKITVRVLPLAAAVRGYVTPRSAFSLYTYPDQGDPRVIAVDTVTTDVVLTSLTEDTQVTRYTNLYKRLRRAALSPRESVEFLVGVAAELAGKQGAS